MVAGKEPHAEEDQLYVGVKIRDEGFTPEIPENCDPTLREVMQMCWQKNPEDRPVSVLYGQINILYFNVETFNRQWKRSPSTCANIRKYLFNLYYTTEYINICSM